MKMQNEPQAQTKILRKRIVILSIAAVLLTMCLCYSFLPRAFFIDGPIVIRAEIDGEEHYLVCQKKKGSTHACSQSLFGELFTRSPRSSLRRYLLQFLYLAH